VSLSFCCCCRCQLGCDIVMDSGTVLRGRGGGWGAVRLFWDACRMMCASSTLVWVDGCGLYICAAVSWMSCVATTWDGLSSRL